MNILFFIILMYIVLFLIVVFFVIVFKSKLRKEWPYIKNDSLLTEAEKKFYFVLAEVIGNDYLIFSKVRMADLLHLPRMSGSNFYHYFNKIQSKHVDFLICDKENIKPLLVIELDDSSHLRLDRIARDLLINNIFENAKLPIIHIKFANPYNKLEVLDKIKKILV